MQALLWIEVLGTPVVLGLLVWIAAPRRQPLSTLLASLLWAATTRAGLFTVAMLAAIFGTNLVQCTFDRAISTALGYDATPVVFALEGDLVARLQELVLPYLPEVARWLLSVFYLAGFIATLLLPLTLFLRNEEGDVRVRRAWLGALTANYALALVFYVFVPVVEVGWYEPAQARPIMEEVFPGLTAALRSGSALDNCLPSLHVSCTVSAWWCGRRLRGEGLPTAGLARAAGLSAALTTAVVLILGIHWATDAAAGLAYGVFCAELGLRYSASQRAASRA